MWSDADEQVIAGDLTAALAYLTPAGGAVLTPVAPLGLRDRDAGTVTFTTSLGFGRKLDRIRENPRIALAYHAREHGFSQRPEYVLVQGRATIVEEPDRDYLEAVIEPAATRFLGGDWDCGCWASIGRPATVSSPEHSRSGHDRTRSTVTLTRTRSS